MYIQVVTITEEDQFLLLGCDGLFDVYTPEEVVGFVTEQMTKHGDAQKCCQVGHCSTVCSCVLLIVDCRLLIVDC